MLERAYLNRPANGKREMVLYILSAMALGKLDIGRSTSNVAIGVENEFDEREAAFQFSSLMSQRVKSSTLYSLKLQSARSRGVASGR